jgi:hypothetical protein
MWVGNNIVVLLPSSNFIKVYLIQNHDIHLAFAHYLPPKFQHSTGVESFSCFYMCYEYLYLLFYTVHPHIHWDLNLTSTIFVTEAFDILVLVFCNNS